MRNLSIAIVKYNQEVNDSQNSLLMNNAEIG